MTTKDTVAQLLAQLKEVRNSVELNKAINNIKAQLKAFDNEDLCEVLIETIVGFFDYVADFDSNSDHLDSDIIAVQKNIISTLNALLKKANPQEFDKNQERINEKLLDSAFLEENIANTIEHDVSQLSLVAHTSSKNLGDFLSSSQRSIDSSTRERSLSDKFYDVREKLQNGEMTGEDASQNMLEILDLMFDLKQRVSENAQEIKVVKDDISKLFAEGQKLRDEFDKHERFDAKNASKLLSKAVEAAQKNASEIEGLKKVQSRLINGFAEEEVITMDSLQDKFYNELKRSFYVLIEKQADIARKRIKDRGRGESGALFVGGVLQTFLPLFGPMVSGAIDFGVGLADKTKQESANWIDNSTNLGTPWSNFLLVCSVAEEITLQFGDKLKEYFSGDLKSKGFDVSLTAEEHVQAFAEYMVKAITRYIIMNPDHPELLNSDKIKTRKDAVELLKNTFAVAAAAGGFSKEETPYAQAAKFIFQPKEKSKGAGRLQVMTMMFTRTMSTFGSHAATEVGNNLGVEYSSDIGDGALGLFRRRNRPENKEVIREPYGRKRSDAFIESHDSFDFNDVDYSDLDSDSGHSTDSTNPLNSGSYTGYGATNLNLNHNQSNGIA